ncbi:MAG: hypothetical protein WDN27_05840 [Candidatus Saccharibacteria bacterium]
MVAERPNIVATHGIDVLYDEGVTNTVGSVSPIPAVRKAVKAGFTKRIQKVVEDESKNILLVDGRNLAPAVEAIPETALVMRTFVGTLSYEGAWRELDRNISLKDAPLHARQDYFMTSEQQLQARNSQDANRETDRVIPDADAIDYWWEQPLLSENLRHFADLYYGGNEMDAWEATTRSSEAFRFLRQGVGSLAVRSGRQIFFDTTNYRQQYPSNPVRPMLEAARQMFSEGLETYQQRARLGLRPAEPLLRTCRRGTSREPF